MKPHPPASFRTGRLGVLISATLLAVSASLSAEPTPPPKAGAPSERPPETADAFPTARPAPPDLLLTKDEERKSNAFAAFAQAIVAEDNSDTDSALDSYRKALELDPANTELAVKVAFMLTEADDPAAGIRVLKDSAKAAPKDPLPLVYLSQIYFKNFKKPELALKYAEQALALDGNFLPGYLAVFELLDAQHQVAKAALLLERAAKATSTDANFWVSLGEIFKRAHFKDDGTPDSPSGLKQTNAIFERAALLGKADAAVLARVAGFFIDSKQLKAAIPYYFKAAGLKRNSDDPALKSAKDKLAQALADTGDRDDAISAIEEVTKSDSSSYEAFELLGELYQQKGESEKALDSYKHGLTLDASGPENFLRVANAQIDLKHFDDAVETSKAARARFPDDPQAYFVLAVSLFAAKRNAEAMTAFADAQHDFETNGLDDYLNAEFFFRYGAAAEQAGLVDKAAELLEKSIDMNPRNASEAYNYLGYMWAERGVHLDEAGDMIRKALEQDPDKAEFQDSLGWVYYMQGEYEKALEQLQQAAERLKPEDATVYDHLADTYLKLGKTADAVRYWQKAIALHQDDIDPKKLAEKLEAAQQKVKSEAAPSAPPPP